MKSFIISLCIFGVVLGVAIWNSFFIDKVTSELLEISNEISLNDSDALSRVEKYWRKNEHIICIFVSHKDIDNVNIALEVLNEKQNYGDELGFYEYTALLKNYVKEIGKKEQFHIDNII